MSITSIIHELEVLWGDVLDLVNSNAAWAAVIGVCAGEVEELLTLELPVVAAAAGLDCVAKLLIEFELLNKNPAIIDFQQYAQGVVTGGISMAAFPNLTSPPVCVTPTGQQHKGICCSALTQLGAAQAAIGFQYTDCKGRTKCMKCGVGQSTSPRHPGRPIFIPRRVSCGPSGCPALNQG